MVYLSETQSYGIYTETYKGDIYKDILKLKNIYMTRNICRLSDPMSDPMTDAMGDPMSNPPGSSYIEYHWCELVI